MWLYDDAKCDHEHNNWRITELYVSSKNGNFFRLLLEWFFRGILRVSLTFSGDFSLSFHLFFLESCKNSELKIVKWKHHGPINCQSYKSFSSEDFQWRTFTWNPHNVHSSVNVQYSLWLLERILDVKGWQPQILIFPLHGIMRWLLTTQSENHTAHLRWSLICFHFPWKWKLKSFLESESEVFYILIPINSRNVLFWILFLFLILNHSFFSSGLILFLLQNLILFQLHSVDLLWGGNGCASCTPL